MAANGSDLKKPTIIFSCTDGEAYGGLTLGVCLGIKSLDGVATPFFELEIGDKAISGAKYTVTQGVPHKVDIEKPHETITTIWSLDPSCEAGSSLSIGDAQMITHTVHMHREDIALALGDAKQISVGDISQVEHFLGDAFGVDIKALVRER